MDDVPSKSIIHDVPDQPKWRSGYLKDCPRLSNCGGELQVKGASAFRGIWCEDCTARLQPIDNFGFYVAYENFCAKSRLAELTTHAFETHRETASIGRIRITSWNDTSRQPSIPWEVWRQRLRKSGYCTRRLRSIVMLTSSYNVRVSHKTG
jgi:hypothetical protein